MLKPIKKFFNNRKEKSIQNAIVTLCDKKTNKDTRLAAIEKLEEESKTHDGALQGLIKRFNFNIEHSIIDNKEKEHVAQILEKHKDRTILFLKENLQTAFNISWTVKILKKLTKEEDLILELLGTLHYQDISFSKDTIEKNFEVLNLLRDFHHPAVYEKTKIFLEDQDERIRLAALEILAEQNPDKAVVDLARFITDTTIENSRLRNRVIEIFHQNCWRVPNAKDFKGGKITEGVFIDNKGIINLVK